MALRIKTGDSAPVYLNKPGYREKLKPSKRRNLFSAPIVLSTEPVLMHRKEASWEALFDASKIDDEMAAPLREGVARARVRYGWGALVDALLELAGECR